VSRDSIQVESGVEADIVAVRDLSELVAQVKDEQGYIVVRERTHRNTAESTNARVKWWSIFQICVLMGEGIFQVWWLKRFFEVSSGMLWKQQWYACDAIMLTYCLGEARCLSQNSCRVGNRPFVICSFGHLAFKHLLVEIVTVLHGEPGNSHDCKMVQATFCLVASSRVLLCDVLVTLPWVSVNLFSSSV
jgi:hypothetical protein